MAYDIKQSSTQSALLFFLVQSADHITGLTGASPTVTLSKNGAAFASPSGAVTEISSGWYKVAGNATDTGTLGPLALHATAASADPCDLLVANIVAYDPQDAVRLGLTALPNVASGSAGAIPTTGTGSNQISVSSGQVILQAGTGAGQLDFTSGVVKANATQWLGGTIPAVNVTGVPLVDLKYTLGTISPATAGYVALDWGQVTNKTTANVLSGTTIGTLTTYTGNTPQTGDVFPRVGAPAGASVSADIAAVKVDTAAVKVQTDKLAFTVANKVDANMLATNGDATAAANVAKTTRAIVRCTASGVPTTTSIPTSACAPSGAVADQFKGRLVVFDADTTTTALRGQASDITASSNSATPTFTITALTTPPVSGDTFSVV